MWKLGRDSMVVGSNIVRNDIFSCYVVSFDIKFASADYYLNRERNNILIGSSLLLHKIVSKFLQIKCIFSLPA